MAYRLAVRAKADAATMEIFLLGAGTSIPNKDHSPAGLIVKADNQNLLFDIGPGTLGRLYLAGITYDQINHLLLTHLHPDHTLDLATLMLVFNYAPGAERTSPFPVTGGRDLSDFFKRMVSLYPEVEPVSFELQFRQVYKDEFSVGGLGLQSAPTGHTPDSVGYRVSDGKRSFVYSGDVKPGSELAQLAAGADLLVSECSFPSGWATEDHLNADTLGSIAQEAAVKSLVVTHCYPPALAVDLIEQIQHRYDGPVRLGYDGLHLML
jgi:ribonuclease BN (tRNA processing enzyme)